MTKKVKKVVKKVNSFDKKNAVFYPKITPKRAKIGQKPPFFCAMCTNFKKIKKILKKVLTFVFLYGIIALSLDKSDLNIDN